MNPNRMRWMPVLPVLLLSLSACAINPATGARELSFISESQEIAMGREYDPQIVAAFGLSADPRAQEMLNSMGQSMASVSERPALPWTFRIVDDPSVNAFAVPGGFIYVTRGIMAHLNSEAELAGVVGHEIGHVTARHSVSQMSRQQLQQIGLVAGAVFSETVREYGGLAQAALGVLNMKYSRGDESESDELGVRYMTRANYDARELVDVFRTLSLVSGEPGQRLPEWQASHPAPENRQARIQQLLAEAGVDYSSARNGTQPYMDVLDGMIFGPNPREGFFTDGGLFRHPELRFRIQFPRAWNRLNEKSRVVAGDPDGSALVQMTLSQSASASAAAQAFASQEGLEVGVIQTRRINGLNAAGFDFQAQTEQAVINGRATFVEHGGNVYEFVGYGSPAGWQQWSNTVNGVMESFAPETDRDVLNAQPWRLDVVRLSAAMTGRQFLDRYPSVAEDDHVLLINRIDESTRLDAGRMMKRVVGEPLPN